MEVSKIRNLALVAQSGSGKTSLGEAMLFTAKSIDRIGRVDDGTSALDYEPEETKRHISISTGFHHLAWEKVKVYLLDTPGDDNFLPETRMAISAVDNILIVLDAVDPVKPQTHKIWSMVSESGLPVIMWINKLDKERADFIRAMEAFRDALDLRLVPVCLPIGKEDGFRGIVDLVRMKAYDFTGDSGGRGKQIDIPSDMVDVVEEWRNNLIEYAAESNDELLEKFLEGIDLSYEEIVAGLKQGIMSGGFIPVACGSALNNIATGSLLDLVVEFMASPDDRGPAVGINPETDSEETRDPSPDAPVSGLVFKTLTDPYSGRLTILRVFSGTLRSDSSLYNPNKDKNERFQKIFVMEGKSQKPVDEAVPGEIIAIAKLKETTTGDTLCEAENPIKYPFSEIPQGVLTYALKPRSRGDEEKITQALQRLQEEDPTLTVTRDSQTNELLVSGNGQIHIDATMDKMERKFGVKVDLTLPKIPYRETIKATKKGVIYRHKKQTGGAGQFAEVHFDISPLPQGQGFEFEEALVGMNVPRNFVPAVEKGLHEALQSGPLAGHPVVDVKVRFYDGKSHEVDSSEMAFKIAAIQCFKKGVLEAKPTLLEPIVKMIITVPDDAVGDIIGDMNSRRGKVMGMEPEDGMQVIEALVPLAEVQRYLLDLNSMTAGRGSYVVEESHFEEVPPKLAEKIVAEARADKE
ncbi:MAG TPA: elongation factor G [Thermodesulfobacteriaceae bacterium]|nr:elongation factor G [Thermodesulfobacteriaceae bacterium]